MIISHRHFKRVVYHVHSLLWFYSTSSMKWLTNSHIHYYQHWAVMHVMNTSSVDWTLNLIYGAHASYTSSILPKLRTIIKLLSLLLCVIKILLRIVEPTANYDSYKLWHLCIAEFHNYFIAVTIMWNNKFTHHDDEWINFSYNYQLGLTWLRT